VGEPVWRWKCAYTSCKGLCCRIDREITLKDIAKVAKATGMKKEQFVQVKSDKKRNIPYILKKRRGKCVFLQNNFQCKLHSLNAKPVLCKTYPFLLNKVVYADEPIMMVKYAQDCPGLGKGPRFGDESVKLLVENIKNYLEGLRETIKLSRRGLTPLQMLEKASS